MRARARVRDDPCMPVLVASRPTPATRSIRAIVLGSLVGLTLLGGGVALGYLTFETGFVDRFTSARPGALQMIVGAIAWTFALTAPALFVIVGLARLVETVDRAMGSRPRPRPLASLAGRLPEDHLVGTRVRLPDGRVVPEVVIGPFGIAVVEELPPPGAARQQGGRWEVRVTNGKWMPIENPLDRASRDAERIRGWLSHEDHDHVVKVYATVVAADPEVPRTPSCAVVATDQLSAWLASLPTQRSFSADRRAGIAELIRAAML